MNRAFLAGMVLAVVALGGCANLSVQVDALSYGSISTEIDRSQTLRDFEAIISQSDAAFQSDVARRKKRAQTEVTNILDDYLPAGASAPGMGPRLVVDEEIDAIFGRYLLRTNPARRALRENAASYRRILTEGGDFRGIQDLVDEVKDSEAALEASLRDELTQPLITVLQPNMVRNKRAQSAVPGVKDDKGLSKNAKVKAQQQATAQDEVNKIEAQATVEAATTATKGAAKVAASARSVVGGPTLFGSGYAALVTGAPENAWKPRFNQAQGDGWMGNSTIVIRMNSQGDFSVKGMSFDPSTVASTAQKASVQAVMMAATIMGAPVRPDSLSKPEDKVGFGAVEPSNAEAERDVAKATLAERRSAVRALAQAILVEDARILGTDAQRQAANSAIAAQANALLPELAGETPAQSEED